MSDIFIKSTTGSGGWKKISKLFVKSTTGSGDGRRQLAYGLKIPLSGLRFGPCQEFLHQEFHI
jgi:hypothetical protein